MNIFLFVPFYAILLNFMKGTGMSDTPPIDGRKSSWTPERKAAAAARCRANKPWQYSTGPVTQNGKMRASLNATKHGRRSQPFPCAVMLMKTHKICLHYFERMEAMDYERNKLSNELIKNHFKKSANALLEKQILEYLINKQNGEGR